ncbi:MAG: sulfur carrier protein ThiS [Paludibacteraceae bacterium]|nr:sulfur carrier protein ThiS [Paludibacteraceae bacterium]
MKININNRLTETQAKNLQELAVGLQLPDKGVAVAVNNQMVPRSQWTETILSEEMNVTIVKAVCGG